MFYLKSFKERREEPNFFISPHAPQQQYFLIQFGATPTGSIPPQSDPTETGDEAALQKISSVRHGSATVSVAL